MRLAGLWPLWMLVLLLGACATPPERVAPERRAPPAAEVSTSALRGHRPAEPPAPREHRSVAPAPSARTATPSARALDTARRSQAPRALIIELASQSFIYSEQGTAVRLGPISSGRTGYRTPTGRFSVLSKDRDKVSSRYRNQLGWPAWMPYSIQFSGHYFLHEGWLPGYPDSHGCVRVPEADAAYLFARLRIGDPIWVLP